MKNQSHCESCWYKIASLRHFGNIKMASKLKSLAGKQNFECIYTGEKLTPGPNMSIDHIIPQSIRPDLKKDIKNMQWVTRGVNSIKRNQTHDEFIELCRFIANRFKDV
jgi:CRISPR/Cas system Type II protein with McrA/HNH and RuvC-like nuclease domain